MLTNHILDMENPFIDTKSEGSNTHLSTWDAKMHGSTFLWTKGDYEIMAEYIKSTYELEISISYKRKTIHEETVVMHKKKPAPRDFARESQRVLANYLKSW